MPLHDPPHLLSLRHLRQDARERNVVWLDAIGAHELQKLGRHDPPSLLRGRVYKVRHEADVRRYPDRARLQEKEEIKKVSLTDRRHPQIRYNRNTSTVQKILKG